LRCVYRHDIRLIGAWFRSGPLSSCLLDGCTVVTLRLPDVLNLISLRRGLGSPLRFFGLSFVMDHGFWVHWSVLFPHAPVLAFPCLSPGLPQHGPLSVWLPHVRAAHLLRSRLPLDLTPRLPAHILQSLRLCTHALTIISCWSTARSPAPLD